MCPRSSRAPVVILSLHQTEEPNPRSVHHVCVSSTSNNSTILCVKKKINMIFFFKYNFKLNILWNIFKRTFDIVFKCVKFWINIWWLSCKYNLKSCTIYFILFYFLYCAEFLIPVDRKSIQNKLKYLLWEHLHML